MAKAVTGAPASFRRTDVWRQLMKFFNSTSAVMALIMAGILTPITIIHFLATSVFH